MKKMKKVYLKIEENLIKLIRYLNTDKYMKLYVKYLSKLGIKFNDGLPKYIDPSCYFDGVDYSKIEVGKDTVISREVMLLTHDYSISRGLQAINRLGNRELRVVEGIKIGRNSFVGARVSILPGSKIGDDVIIGAGSVIRGNIPDNSIVIGNPSKIIGDTKAWAENKYKKGIF
ncbi:acyltransferase [Clostridium sp.]|uniref:acyltransferase n=1 Tax=Clostridium sp. TaxID=1506 RepID=UPI0026221E85|nr:acyltransferase [Clostridium sp.]